MPKTRVFISVYKKGIGEVRSQQEYQRELAVSLMKSVGFDSAVDCALQNHWQGVLAQLFSLPREILVEDGGTHVLRSKAFRPGV